MEKKESYETINHPPHYNKHPCGIECVKVIQEFPFNIGTAVKHLWRAGMKPGVDIREDLRKAIRYVQYELERLGESA